MKKYLIGLMLIAFILVSVLVINQIRKNNVLENAGLANLETRELIQKLEDNEYAGDVRASITDDEVIVTIESFEYKFAIEEDLLYISFAPYENLTHECYTHSLTGCKGELVDQEFYVIIYDLEGNVLQEGFYNSEKDGFIGLFLDSDQVYLISVSSESLSSEFIVDGSLDQTCFTEVKLS